ncbi:MAG: hypothetical protein H0V39_04265 [Nitrosomonas sp.]|nr:hypothetical protein [Nitrosomonas sp.]
MTLPEQQSRHIEAWQANGLLQSAYSRERGLKYKTLRNWLRTYRVAQLREELILMIPVAITPAAPVFRLIEAALFRRSYTRTADECIAAMAERIVEPIFLS